MELEVQGHCVEADSNGATQHVRWNYPRLTIVMDVRGLKGGV